MPPKTDINELLEVQSRAYKDATQTLFESLSKRVDDLVKTVLGLQQSLEFSQAELRETKDNLIQSNQQLNEYKKKNEENVQKINKLEEKLDNLENYSRKNNIRIDGVEEPSSETNEMLHVKVKKLIEEKLQSKNVDFETIHRLPVNKGQTSTPRTIIARLTNYRTRDDIMKNKSKLKGTGIYLNEDLSENTMKARKEKLEEFKKARSLGKIAFFKGKNLIVRERRNDAEAKNLGQKTPPPRAVSELVDVFTPKTQEVGAEKQSVNLNDNQTSGRSGLRSQSGIIG